MELRHLKYFKVVAEELHFGKAANRLNMTQPPLSLQINQLEEEIGVSLFHRTKRSVKLTIEGKAFLDEVEKILENLDEAIETVKMINRGEVGEIIIGFIATVTYNVLPNIIKHYRKEHPGVKVILKQLTSEEQMLALQNGTIHIAVLSDPAENEEMKYQIIWKEPLVVALPKEHVLAEDETPIELSKLANDLFILTGRKANKNHYDAIINCCYRAGFSPTIVQETNEVSTVLALVAAGIGVALVPSSIQLLLKNEVVYRNITDTEFNSVTALAWNKKNQTPIVDTFIDFVLHSVYPVHK